MRNLSKRYSELILLPTFIERYRYLKLGGSVGIETFGFDRYLNQVFYKSNEWKIARREVILRDNSCDLGDPERPIFGSVIIHHLNPITEEDILKRRDWIYDPEFLVCCADKTHKAIHYGDESLLFLGIVERQPNDTSPWLRV